MGEDEAGTLARLRIHRRELIDPKVADHEGRVVKTTGDGILIEFPSVVEAVACAVAMQRGMAKRNVSVPENQRIVFRVGVNLGDIIVEDGDIHGDGVNLAACYAQMRRFDEARVIVARLRAITPLVMPSDLPWRNPEDRELYVSGLRLAAGEAA